MVKGIAEAQNGLVTKQDLKETELRLETRFEHIDGELKLNRWILGVLLAGFISLVLKAFFYSNALKQIRLQSIGHSTLVGAMAVC